MDEVTQRARPSLDTVVVTALLALVLLAGAYFRFTGLNWDDYVHFHPDERFLTGVVTSLGNGLSFSLVNVEGYTTVAVQQERCLNRYPESGGVGGFFDAQCSNFNPHNVGQGLYVYGTLPLFIAKIASDSVVWATGDGIWSSYEGAHLIWRAASAVADLLTILLVFLIGVRLHNKWVGVLAAGLYACAPFAIQQSHFGTVDAMATTFVMLALYFAVRVQDDGGLLDYGLFGLALAAAVASRVNLAPLAGIIVVAAGVRLLPALDSGLAWRERRRLGWYHVGGLLLSGIVAVAAFRIFSPYTFLGPGFLGLAPNPRWFYDLAQSRFSVSGEAESPPNWQWVGRPSYLFPLSNMVLWGMGIALGAAGWLAWVWSGWRLVRARMAATRNLLLFVWVGVYFAFMGNLWVMTMRYYLPLYPALALLAAWGLVELLRRTRRPATATWRKAGAWAVMAGVVGFTALWALMFTNIYRHQATFVQAANWVWENIPGDFAMRIDNAPNAPLINIPIYNQLSSDPSMTAQLTQLVEGFPITVRFTAPADGIVTSVHVPHLGDPLDTGRPMTLRITINSLDAAATLSQATYTAALTHATSRFGDPHDIPLDDPLVVEAGKQYTFTVEVVAGGPVTTAGAIMAVDGQWDESNGVPPKVCTLPPGMTLADDPPPGLLDAYTCNGRDVWSGLLNMYNLDIFGEDVESKRSLWIDALDNSDYIFILTNRRYDSQTRIPSRWPLTLAYYEALFSGDLGFEPLVQFQETFEFGPFRVSDQYLPTYTAPKWLNELEAEEAFHVYDHPAVLVFQKTSRYTSQHMRAILFNVPLNRPEEVAGYYNCPTDPANAYCDPTLIGVVPLWSVPADKAPTQLQLTPDMRAEQYDNGTWSERFDTSAPINTQPALAVVGWWLAIILFGLIAWPLLFAAFPALEDRGYALAKLTGILLTAWLAWLLSSGRIPMWSQRGIQVVMLLVALISLYMGWRFRRELLDYIHSHRRRLLAIEVVSLVLYLFFVFVRLTNPDLWVPGYGGEKPMDFAYFNGVLRSTIFPAIDPWYSGGYLNYYYFGYVIVGTPTLLLGVKPALAYNLILPTLFSLTGTAAFSVAFNLVSGWYERRQAARHESAPVRRLGNPWVAGIAALLLAVVLGNLDTVRVIGNGIAQLGGYQVSLGLQDYLTKQYEATYGVAPEGAALEAIIERANRNNIADRLTYEINLSASAVGGIIRGMGLVLGGQPLQINPDRWFWAPTRVLAETPGVEGQAITEFPYFTFLYGDLHAHMIDMPVILLVMGFLLNELLAVGNEKRGRLGQFAGIALGALALGITRMTNTWDWITFLILCIIGLTYVWWLRWRRITRRSLVGFIVWVGGFVALNFLFVLPYTTWFATTSESVTIWQGGKTPLWAYIDIHGVFLFLLLSLLLWETARWLRSVPARSLRGTWSALVISLVSLVCIVFGVVVAGAAGYQVALIVIPAAIWIALLFFRPGQSRAMQYVLVLAGLALALTLGVEIIVLGVDIERQNTVFKFYIQAWLLFSVVGGAAFAWLVESSSNWSAWLRGMWYAVAGVLVAIAALYPVMATRGKAVYRMAPDVPITLDGMDYMKYSQEGENNVWFPLKEDYELIRWMEENIKGTPVIMEGRSAHEYLWGSRIAINTGLPSVLGWRWHQTQQRTFEPMGQLINQRLANVNSFYSITDIPATVAMIQWYGVHYVVVGGLERAYYPEEGLAKFDQMVKEGYLEVAFSTGSTHLYRVKDSLLNAVVEARQEQGS